MEVVAGGESTLIYPAQQLRLRQACRSHHVCSRSPLAATKARSLSGNCIATPWVSNCVLMCLVTATMRCSNSGDISSHGT